MLESRSVSQPIMVVFEDDGDTGYFYALDLGRSQSERIVDVLQIYLVSPDTRGCVRLIRIAWSADGCKAGLLVDGDIEAVFDFDGRRGMSRSGFPAAPGQWSRAVPLSHDQLRAAFAAMSDQADW